MTEPNISSRNKRLPSLGEVSPSHLCLTHFDDFCLLDEMLITLKIICFLITKHVNLALTSKPLVVLSFCIQLFQLTLSD